MIQRGRDSNSAQSGGFDLETSLSEPAGKIHLQQDVYCIPTVAPLKDFETFGRKTLRCLGLFDEAERFTLERSEQDLDKVAKLLWAMNQFLYVTTDELQGDAISAYHRFWRDNHEQLLDLRIDEPKCARVADILEILFATHADRLRPNLDGITSLTPELIANARFFTAVQDFTIRLRQSPYQVASRHPELFDASRIAEEGEVIDSLLRELGAESQYDKRRKFARLCAELLLEHYDGQARNIPDAHRRNAVEIRNNLVDNPHERFKGSLGFSEKKANMLIRDLYELGVWSNLSNLEGLDVSSDANTMRIALRLGILRSRIPLLTSYLDVYCYQYNLMNKVASRAWREVWNKWGERQSNHRVAAPAFFDFLVYRIGQICCRPNTRACDLPCRGSRLQQLRALIPDTDGYCPFRGLEEETTIMLNPPRSISIFGRTGWISGKTNTGGGGGISS